MPVKLERGRLSRLWSAIGVSKPAASDDAHMKRIAKLPLWIDTPDYVEPKAAEDMETLVKVLEAVNMEMPVVLVDDGEGDKKPGGNGRHASAPEVTVRRGRPKKGKPEEAAAEPAPAPAPKAEPEEDDGGDGMEIRPEPNPLLQPAEAFDLDRTFKFEETEPAKLVKVTKALAEEFRDMTLFPRDRGVQKNRMQYLAEECANNTFRGPEWVSCQVEEDGVTYRLNGKHTSTLLAGLYEEGRPYETRALVRRYKCPTLEDAAHLFATFDARQSARSKADVVRGYAATHAPTKDLAPRILSVLTSGVAFAHLEVGYSRLNPAKQAELLLKYDAFTTWAGKFLTEAHDSKDEDKKHVVRMSVCAAMFKTWNKNPKRAVEFWTKVRDDCDEPASSPVRRLYKQLRDAKISRSRASGVRAGEREVYLWCLKAWNWAVTGQEPKGGLKYRDGEATPEVKG